MAIRERKEELSTVIGGGNFVANADNVLPGIGIPRDLPLSRLELTLEGRLQLVTAAASTSNFYPEAPQSLVRRIKVRGTKVSGGGSITLVDIRGEEAHFLSRIYDGYVPYGSNLSDTANIAAGGQGTAGVQFPMVQRAGVNILGTSLTAQGSGADTMPQQAASLTVQNDFRVKYVVPFAPPLAMINDEIEGILDPSIFSQLDLIVTFGDSTFLTGNNVGTVTPTLSNFGLATGNPTMRVTRFSPLAEGLPIMRRHYTYLSKQITQGTLGSATNTNAKVTDLNVGNKIRAVILRQYSEAAGKVGLIDVSAAAPGVSLARPGDNANIGFYRWYAKLNGAPKFQMHNSDLRELNRRHYNQFLTTLPQGYSILEWADRGFMDTVFDTRGFGGTGTRWELFADWLALATTDRLDVLQIEQVPVEV